MSHNCTCPHANEGFLCGNPTCPKVIEMEKTLQRLGDTLCKYTAIDEPFVLPDYCNKHSNIS